MKTMRLAVVVLCLATFANCSLLEMSQSLWSQLLAGGISKVGSLDPLRVPVIKVDQSEGNTSYRIILRNVQLIGLNDSTLESIHVERGKLKSNLSELEAGYVSYSDISGLDSIRYRFHTVVKGSKQNQSEDALTVAASDQSQAKTPYNSADRYDARDRFRQNDPQFARYQSGQYTDPNQQRYQDGRVDGNRGTYQDQTSRQYDQQQQRPYSQGEFTKGGSRQYSRGQGQYNDDRRFPDGQYDSRSTSGLQEPQTYNQASSGTQRTPFQERQNEDDRQRQYNPQYSRIQEARPETSGPGQRFDSSNRAYQVEISRVPGQERQEYSGRLRQDDQRDRYGNDQARYQDTYPGVKTVGSAAPAQYNRNPSSFQVSSDRRQDDPRFDDQARRGNYEDRSRGELERLDSSRKGDDAVVDCRGACQRGQYTASREFANQRQNQRVEDPRYSTNRDFNRDRQTAEGLEIKLSKIDQKKDDEVDDAVYVDGRPVQRGHSASDCRYPRMRSEKEPGYIDIVYADGKENSPVKHFGNLRIDPNDDDTKVYGLDDIKKDIRENRRFIVHNFTEGEALTKRNDAILTAMEAKRMKDLIRYANDYEEKEGFFEEGVELIYHYGGMNRTGTENPREYEGRRIKRADTQNNTEDDIMHVILRVKVPTLLVKSQYELTGKVGREVLRGNGKLFGNFTELIGDFTIELGKVDQDQMVVRAARAKLVAKDKNISLQGMNMKGPIESVLNYGFMAAEAVAAMLADDLATKALSEKTADALVYRMYKNLPPN
ncbi:uncharacterized protein [Prorops nasuta]|uniref:uncharacterized protein n=1 Tax=Prorops nasuta TaxID=863751 RepID=UPI0034CED779